MCRASCTGKRKRDSAGYRSLQLSFSHTQDVITGSWLLLAGAKLHNLIHAFVLWNIKIILFCNRWRQEPKYSLSISLLAHLHCRAWSRLPSTNKMRSPKMLNQRLRRSQTDQSLRIEFRTWSLCWRPILYTPAGRCINRQYRNLGRLHSRDDIFEGIPHFAREAESENGVYDMVCGLQG